jgi:hypothetical protein
MSEQMFDWNEAQRRLRERMIARGELPHPEPCERCGRTIGRHPPWCRHWQDGQK